MGLENLINQIGQNTENLKNVDIKSIAEANLQPWNGLEFEDFENNINEVVDILETSLELSVFSNYPFNIVNATLNNLSKVVQLIQQTVDQTNQQNYQKAFQQLESYRTNLRSWGIYSYVNYEYNIEEKIKTFDSDYQNFLTKKQDVEELKKSVQQLIEPAVSGSLSKSFSDRKSDIKKNTNVWLAISIISAIIAIIATYLVVDSLLSTFTLPEGASSDQIDKFLDQRPSYGLINLIRLGILFPVYTFFIYSFNQYRKERNLEEEYAHRAAVASSLPNYGDLAVDPTVKDQIVSGASNVVFRSPINHKTQRDDDLNENNSIEKVQDLLESIRKLVLKE